SETLVKMILEKYGVSYEDIEEWGGSVTHVSHDDAVGLMKDKHADVYASIPSLQFPAVVDLTTNEDVNFLNLDEELIYENAEEQNLLTGSLPADTYKGQNHDYYSLMETQLLIANTDSLTDEQAYNVVRLLDEKIDKLRNAHSDMNNFDIKT